MRNVTGGLQERGLAMTGMHWRLSSTLAFFKRLLFSVIPRLVLGIHGAALSVWALFYGMAERSVLGIPRYEPKDSETVRRD